MISLYQINGSLQPFANLLFLPVAVLISIWVVTTTVSSTRLDCIMNFAVNQQTTGKEMDAPSQTALATCQG
jgi:hypothetical protein